MMRAALRLVVLATLAWSVILDSASAHGLLARVRTDGNVIVGTAFYSSGERAAGDWVEIFDVSGEQKVAEFSSEPDGTFSYQGTPGHRYRIAIHGEEGHSIELSIAIQQGARASLVEDQVEPAASSLSEFPAWLVVGGALTITSLLAVFYRFRDFRRGRKVGVNA
jgi:hypothetical protein